MTADHAAIRARLDAITPGPWEALTDPGDRKTAPHHVIDTNDEKRWFRAEGEQDLQAFQNAQFIAHAPEYMRALLAENEALLAVIDAAPHEELCFIRSGRCSCWKSRVRSDAQDVSS